MHEFHLLKLTSTRAVDLYHIQIGKVPCLQVAEP
jgi:hypothetical protein